MDKPQTVEGIIRCKGVGGHYYCQKHIAEGYANVQRIKEVCPKCLVKAIEQHYNKKIEEAHSKGYKAGAKEESIIKKTWYTEKHNESLERIRGKALEVNSREKRSAFVTKDIDAEKW